jgi:hypothetical protein
LTAFIFSDLNYEIVIFLSQTESTPKHFLRKKALTMSVKDVKNLNPFYINKALGPVEEPVKNAFVV